MVQHRFEGRNGDPITLKRVAEHRRLSAAPDLLVGWHFFCYRVERTEPLLLKPMNDNQVRMLPPPQQSWTDWFRRRTKTFAPMVAIALFVAGFLGSTDLQAATYVRVNVGGRPYYGYPYRYHGYYRYRGGRYRYRYYRYGHWHYY
jgi:hypothetical protein